MEQKFIRDNTKSYSEVCNAIRHYSNLSFTVRTLSIIQGLVILGVWFDNYDKNQYILLITLPIFGLLFTSLIYRFHKGYFDAVSFFIDHARQAEYELFDEGHRPYSSFKIYHVSKYKGKFAQVFILNAPFTFIGMLFVVALFLTTCKYYLLLK